ncbi:hypothetical protein PMAC_002759 [Pneumocystis sp. 'macacae']|nr:hypothetical protein PMAC_002759 [Pneumocystis sp. 'macacae']
MIINDIFYDSEKNRPILNIKVSMNIEKPDFLKNLLKMCLQKEIFLLIAMEKFQYFIPDFEINPIETDIWVATIVKSARIPVEIVQTKNSKLLRKKEIKDKTFFLTQKYRLDVLLQNNNVYKKKRLIVFKMDSVLIKQEVIDQIAYSCGIFEEVSVITQASMNEIIDFSESLKQKVPLLKDTHLNIFEDSKKRLFFTDGAHLLSKILKEIDFKTAVISERFMSIANHMKEVLNLDYAYANNIEISEDDRQKKVEILKSIADTENINVNDVNEIIAIGNNFNDLCMLNTAGLGTAFNAKPKLQERVYIYKYIRVFPNITGFE